MSDPSDHPEPTRQPASDHDLEVDIGAFLPEGSVLAGSDDDATDEAPVDDDPGWGDDADAPEIPAWARDDLDPAPARPEPTGSDPDGQAAAPAPQAEAAPPAVDVAVLARIEEELTAVDEALGAIDAGDLGRSALLVDLVGPEIAARHDG